MLRRPAACPNGYWHVFRGGNAWYDVVRLWEYAISLPGSRIGADQFPRLMDTEIWNGDTPNDHSFDGEHWERVLEADLEFPILSWMENGSLEVVDGFHRITKAFLLDRSFIRAVDVTSKLDRVRLVDDWEAVATLDAIVEREKSA